MENVVAWANTAEIEPVLEPEMSATRGIEPDSTVAELAFTVMREQFAVIIALSPVVHADGGADPVHDMRVAVRRLRAALAVFKDALPQRTARMRTELRWLTQLLGPVREVDVLKEQIVGWLEDASADEGPGLDTLDALLTERREAAVARLVRALDSRRFARLLESLTAFLGRGPSARLPAAVLPAVVVVPELLAKRYRSLRKAGRRADRSSPGDQLHALRIGSKRFRYAVEFVAPLYPDPSKAMIRRLARLQDVLGEIHDAEVAILHLRSFGEQAGRKVPAKVLFAMGRLAERHGQKASALRRSFPGSLKAIEGKRWKRLKREMEHRRRAGVVPIVGG